MDHANVPRDTRFDLRAAYNATRIIGGEPSRFSSSYVCYFTAIYQVVF